jgi:hypothetical protein
MTMRDTFPVPIYLTGLWGGAMISLVGGIVGSIILAAGGLFITCIALYWGISIARRG